MAKYRGKMVEALQWTGDMLDFELVMGLANGEPVGANGDRLVIYDPLGGHRVVHPGEWIIRTEAGKLFPCAADLFAAVFEPVQ